MQIGHLKQVQGTNQYVYVMEETQAGRTVRRTSPRMRKEEAMDYLRSQGLSDVQVQQAVEKAERPHS